jgi:hypothetical protein
VDCIPQRKPPKLKLKPPKAPEAFSIHDILDGRFSPSEEPEPFYDPLARPAWLENDGIGMMGMPYGSPKFVEDYLNNKLVKHKHLLSFIKDVAKMGYSREAHQQRVPHFREWHMCLNQCRRTNNPNNRRKRLTVNTSRPVWNVFAPQHWNRTRQHKSNET